MSTIIVVGSSGYIGYYVATALAPLAEVIAIDQKDPPNTLSVKQIKREFSSQQCVDELLQNVPRVAPIILILSGFYPKAKEQREKLTEASFDNDFLTITTAIDIASTTGGSIVFFSTLPVGQRLNGAWETMLKPYFLAKRKCEELLMDHAYKYKGLLILRPARVLGFGLTLSTNVLPIDPIASMLNATINEGVVHLAVPGGKAPYLHIRDLIEFLLKILQIKSIYGRSQVIDLSSTDAISPEEIFSLVSNYVNRKVKLDIITTSSANLHPANNSFISKSAKETIELAIKDYYPLFER